MYNRKSPGNTSSTKTDFNNNTNTNSNNQSTTLPAISLPKGGGAIRGIGEKFGANPVTGTASVSIPIFTSPGRSGFGPSLSLSYDSGAGNGPFGFGWNLSLPSITRKTDKGLPLYQDAEESDTFILSGSEDLVPILVQADDEEWQHENLPPRDIDGVSYKVNRYRPRIEGLFARIERWTNLQNGEIHWRSISRDNITTLYGKTEESRISDPHDPSHIFSWLICESHDDKGNAILYQYKEENSQGIKLLLHERNRNDTTRSANRYLKRIKYGNKTPYQIDEDLTERKDWMFEVVFDYGEHYTEDDQGQPTDVFLEDDQLEWHVRLDPFSTYRSGFEVRTYRLCQRVLMFHHFPAELGVDDYLVQATAFTYDESPIASFITSVTQSGYRRLPDGSYLKKSMPPVEFEYSKATINEEIKEIDSESLENLPYGIDGMRYQWVDLDYEGVSGILTEQGDAWFYKPNLGGGKFGPIERVAFKPSIGSLNSPEHKLIDLAGNGKLDLVELGNGTPGFYERNHDQNWESFVPFESLPNVNWNDPNLRFVDLTGDAHPDILVTENEALTWYPSLAERGFGSASSTTTTAATANLMLGSQDEEEHGPRLVFSDSTQSIYLADMSGDALTDLVRIRNGEVCYWPNLGYGRFGSKVTMDNSPWFDAPDMFDQSRIRLADIDGSSLADIIYIGQDDGVRLYFNESGNSWAEPVLLTHFPHIDNISSVTALDLLGNGTACLVWSSPLPGDTHGPIRYVDLMGSQKEEDEDEEAKEERIMRGRGKPHLLTLIKNNMGAETHVKYASSIKFYLADKAAGKPWVTKLPFPVYVVERVKTYDHISRNIFVSHYTYHHGYFDGIEREFRGFGMVEQYDTEEFGTFSSESEEGVLPLKGENIDASFHVPPVLTKTWFHTGIYVGRDHVSNFFAGQLDKHDKGEYYREPAWENDDEEAKKHVLDDTLLPPQLLTVEEEREACRALKGSMLRQEVYALDGTDKTQHPYTVTEQNFSIRMLQPLGDNSNNNKNNKNRHAVFFTHNHEAITYHYERDPDDPRVSHSMTLEVDNFGNVLKQASIGYRRRKPDPELPLQSDRDKQTQSLITYTENLVTNAIGLEEGEEDDYRTPLPCESRTYELTGDYKPSGSAGRFLYSDFVQPNPDPNKPDTLVHIFDSELDYEEDDHHHNHNQPSATTNNNESRVRRLIEQMRTLYRKDDLTDLCRLGELEPLALQGESYKLAFTPGLLAQVFERNGQPLLPDDPTNPNNVNDVLGGTGGDKGGYASSQQLKAEGKFPDDDPDKHWWIPTGRVFYSTRSGDDAAVELEFAREHFFLPHRFRDPFGKKTTVAYDSDETNQQQRNYNLLMTETRDPVGNRVNVVNDYRVLQPGLVTDPNRNRMEAKFDTLGMVTGIAVKGKNDTVGDNLNEFEADLSQDQINEFFDASDPHLPARALLKEATTRVIYDLHRFYRTQKDHPEDPTRWLPVYAATLTRETHARDPLLSPPPTDGPKIQISFSYSDGFGREIQKKIQAEPEPGTMLIIPRWVGSGWTVFNNKGKKPVRQFEPFFSKLPTGEGHHFEFGVREGVSPILFYDPVERVVTTLHPNHTYEKVVFDPWQQISYDVNDTVAPHGARQTGDPRTDPDIHGYVEKYFAAISNDPTTPPWETWLQQRQDGAKGPEEEDAAEKAAAHADTPTTVYFDTLGRPFLIMAHNGFKPDETPDQYPTRIELDIEGNQRAVRDAIVQGGDELGRIVMLYDYDMLGNRIHQLSMEAGERWMLNDVTGKPIRAWDSRGHDFRFEYDQLRRPLRSFVTGADPSDPSQELLTERLVYGEQHREDELRNLRGKLYLQLDLAGVARNESYDFKGNLLGVSRRLAKEYRHSVDWRTADDDSLVVLEANLQSMLEIETFTSRTAYDALNRPVQIIAPRSDQPDAKRNIIQPVYNDASLLEQVHVWLDHPTEPEGLLDPAIVPPSPVGVNNIDYDAKGQRKRIDYKNRTITLYDYDEQTFRLVHLLTLRDATTFPDDCPEHSPTGWEGCQVQNLHYTYDPVGNITKIHDDAQQTIFFRNQLVEPSAEYIYDAIYRLIEATGREHLGQVGGPPIPHSYNDVPRVGLLHPNDGRAMGTYEERYVYDAVGNLLEMHHEGTEPSHPGWTRNYAYRETSLIEDGTAGTLEKTSNRLSSTRVDGDNPPVHTYAYDDHGNMTQMPQLQIMQYDFKDQLCMTQRQKVNDEDDDGNERHGERTYYVYDTAGKRTRKITELPSGRLKDERIYLGQFEVYRRHSGADAGLVRETLHIMDDKKRIALVETRNTSNDIEDDSPEQLIRYQFTSHLGSAVLELDEQARIISYEEYYPYGSTSYQALRKGGEANPKRYRFTGKERDEESGLYYHGARYYSPWLGNWISCDPVGLIDGVSLYRYSRSNPVSNLDFSGTESEGWWDLAVGVVESGLTPLGHLALEGMQELQYAPVPNYTKQQSAKPSQLTVEPGPLIEWGIEAGKGLAEIAEPLVSSFIGQSGKLPQKGNLEPTGLGRLMRLRETINDQTNPVLQGIDLTQNLIEHWEAGEMRAAGNDLGNLAQLAFSTVMGARGAYINIKGFSSIRAAPKPPTTPVRGAMPGGGSTVTRTISQASTARLTRAIENRMRALGIPKKAIGMKPVKGQQVPGESGRGYSPENLDAGGNVRGRGISVGRGVLEDIPDFPEWNAARLSTRIDAVIAHEWTEYNIKNPNRIAAHQEALKLAPKTRLKISDEARALLHKQQERFANK